MMLKGSHWLRALVNVLLLVGLAGCSSLPLASPTMTPTLEPTNTPLPPTATPIPPTDTPLPPTATFTEAPTLTPEDTPTPLPSPTPAPPKATPSEDEAILLYYINKDVKGRWGCGEELFWLNTGIARTGRIELDVKTALQRLFSYHGEYIGTLYNPGYSATFAVSGVEVSADATISVQLTGNYEKTKDECDPRRLIDQIKQTVRQFGIQRVIVYLNGAPIADALSRK